MTIPDWQDLCDADSGTRVRVSRPVLEQLGRAGVFQIATHLMSQDPEIANRNDERARAYNYQAKGLRLIVSVLLFERGTLPVVTISSQQEWSEHHKGRAEWDWN